MLLFFSATSIANSEKEKKEKKENKKSEEEIEMEY